MRRPGLAVVTTVMTIVGSLASCGEDVRRDQAGPPGGSVAPSDQVAYTAVVPCKARPGPLAVAIRSHRVVSDAFVGTSPVSHVTISRSNVFALSWLVDQIRLLDSAINSSERVRTLSDDALSAEWERVDPVVADFSSTKGERDAVLLELVRRGGPRWREAVRGRFLEMIAARNALESAERWPGGELEELLTWYRLEGLEDPVAITLDWPGESATGRLGAVRYFIENRSAYPLSFQSGGDYRSGRAERLHVEIRNAEGTRTEGVPWSREDLGGISMRKVLQPGERTEGLVSMNRYAEHPPVGRYEVRLHYSDLRAIAEPCALEGAVTVRSPWYDLVVELGR